MPSIASVTDRLNRIGGNFAGMTRGRGRASFRGHGSRVEADLSFDDTPVGTAARLVTEFILRQRATRIESAIHDSPGGGQMRFSMDVADAARFARAFGYAGTEGLGQAPSRRKAGGVPLPTLLSHALIAFERDYGDAGLDSPSLPVWSNVLRVFGTEAITDRELSQRAILSKRVVRVVLRGFTNLGWLESDTGRNRAFHLTDRGMTLEGVARRRLAKVEGQWRKRHGPAAIESLRDDLAVIASKLELEWPWHLTGYGPADPSLTGGSYLPAKPGPPRVLGRGTEWPVVPRDASRPVTELPLPALLSKVLAAFTVDYEEEHLGPLGAASVFLAQIPDDAITLARASAICDVGGTGKSAPERHLCVVVEPGRPRDGSRKVYLTPKARRIRESYPALVMDIEARWRERFGAGVLDGLHRTLTTLDAETPPGTPDFPDTRAWLHPASLKARGAMGRVTADGQPVHLAWHSGQSR